MVKPTKINKIFLNKSRLCVFSKFIIEIDAILIIKLQNGKNDI